MEEYLRNFVVYPFDRALCLKWAEVSDCARRNGRRIECADGWIAGAAVLHNIPLVTHNSKDFAGVDGLSVIAVARPRVSRLCRMGGGGRSLRKQRLSILATLYPIGRMSCRYHLFRCVRLTNSLGPYRC
jgi:hypothetical protein